MNKIISLSHSSSYTLNIKKKPLFFVPFGDDLGKQAASELQAF